VTLRALNAPAGCRRAKNRLGPQTANLVHFAPMSLKRLNPVGMVGIK